MIIGKRIHVEVKLDDLAFSIISFLNENSMEFLEKKKKKKNGLARN